MQDIQWEACFQEQIHKRKGANNTSIKRFVASVLMPLSTSDLDSCRHDSSVKAKIIKRPPKLSSPEDPERWIIPSGPLPPAYLSFLRWSNGGEFRNGDRLLQFFGTSGDNGVREMMLAYRVPYWAPGLLPFAFDGGGVFYAFDMRYRPHKGEYQIVTAESGYAHTPFDLEATFIEACRSEVSIESKWDIKSEVTRPMCDDCGEFLICPKCRKCGPTKHS